MYEIREMEQKRYTEYVLFIEGVEVYRSISPKGRIQDLIKEYENGQFVHNYLHGEGIRTKKR